MKIFAKRLNELMEDEKISAYKLAKEIKVNIQSVINWQNAKNEPKLSHIKKIADYFGVCSDYLLGRQEYY